MTVTEKREAIREFCEGKKCDECPLGKYTSVYNVVCSSLSDELVHALHYNLVMSNNSVSVNTCVSCGTEIPEGRQVYPDCEAKHNENLVILGDDVDNPPEKLNEIIESLKESIEPDPIKPDYYNDTKITPFDVIDDWGLNFYLGNAVKYIKRAGKKAGNSRLQDLKKIREYIDHEIRAEEGER